VKLLLAATALLVAAAPLASASPAPQLHVSGQGGQTAQLVVGAGGMTLEYPVFGGDRLPGGDGAVGGLLVQRSDGRVLGGVLLENVPGRDDAIALPVGDWERTRLPAGRYRLTLLGSGPQTVSLDVRGAARTLRASGPARPVTRSTASSGLLLDRWNEQLTVRPGDFVYAGAGSGGEMQQAGDSATCLAPADQPEETCIGGEQVFASPGPGGAWGWGTSIYSPGTLEPGEYAFTGHAVGVGLSTAGHSTVVISPRR
jgi:hypothetical protein